MNQSKRNTTTIRPEPWWLRTFRIFFLFVFVLGNMFQGLSPTRVVQAVGEAPMQTYFLSMPEDQVRTPFVVLDTGRNRIGNTMVSITSIATTVNGTIIYYDQWEDGYEALSTTPAQSSTLVFGDGNTANGNACTYAQPASLCSDDVLTSGAVLVLRNNVPSNPRGTGTYFDARDKLATTQVVAVTRAMWDSNTGTVLAGALQVYDTSGYGIDFRLPVGENVSASAMFDYAGLFVMAANDGTTVSIDSDGDGDTDYTSTLSAGGAYFLSSATSGVTLNSNARITSNLPIQVNLITGDINNNEWYENRWFNIPPLAMLGSSYVTPVSSMSNSNSNVFIYNPNQSSAITVYAQTGSGTTSFSVAARGTYRYVMPTGSGARFYTNNGAVFMAIGTNDSPAVGNNGDSAGASWDWGYTLIAEELLAPSLAVGWAPGNSNVPLTTENGSPVWVSAAAATTIYVDYDGNPATGTYTDVNGNHYDTSYTVTALQSIRIYDPDDNQTAMRVYTVDGTLLAATWGEDTSEAGTGTPYLDMGYVIFPLPQMVLTKDGVLDVTIVTPLDQANAGDVVHYTLVATNNGTRTLTNVTIVDPKLGTLACTPTQPATLASGASMTCTGNYTLTQADINAGVVYNSAIGDSNQTPPTTVQEEVKIPLLSVIKTASPTSVPETGGSVTFTFTVKNNNSVASGVSLVILNLSDTVYGTLAGDSNCQVGTVLAPQASCDFSITRTVSGDAELGGSHTNKFTAVAEDAGAGNDPDVSASDNETVTITDVDPAIDIEKFISVDGGDTWLDEDAATGPLVFSGTTPLFQFVVTNTGLVTLNAITLNDANFAAFYESDLSTTCAIPATLAPAASFTCYAQLAWAAGQHTNTATATGSMTDGAGNVEPASDSDPANYFGAVPGLNLTKSAAPGTYDAVGQTITYSYVITNTGNYTLSGPFSVTDNKATVSCTQPDDGELSPTETMSCTASYTITQADLDADHVTNKATASGGGLTSNEATATVYAVPHPGLALDKTVTSSGPYDSVGDTVSYSYELTNNGNVALRPPYAVEDDKVTVTCPQTPNPLPVGGKLTCTASYAITQVDLDAGEVVNIAQASATYGGNPVNSNEDTAEVTTVQSPALSIDKTASPLIYDAAGEVISYSYLVTNTGNVTLTDPITVSDNKATASCPALPVGGLAPGASITCSASYTILQSDMDAGSVTNVAFASSGTIISPTDQETVTAKQDPALTLVKSASPATYNAAGQTISYTYVLTNSGDVTLSGPFTVDDDKATVTCPPEVTSLAVGGTLTCTASHIVIQAEVDSGSITNVAQAHAFHGTTPVDSNEDDETVTALKNPALTIVKIADPTTYDYAGDVISYSYLVTNSGNVTLYGISVEDDKATDESCPSTTGGLAPGASITCTASYTITQFDMDSGSVTNTAYATDGTTQSTPDSETVNAIQQGGLGLEKSAAPATYSAVGDSITYTYVVENTGNITLAGPFTVNDDKVGAVDCGTGPLAPGHTVTCTAIYTIQQGDLDAGLLTNLATATDGELTSNEATATVAAIQSPALSIDKTAQEETYAVAGDLIHYSYVVTNSGNVTLSGPFTVNDDRAEDESCPATASLAPGASITCTASYVIQQSDLDAGELTNVASATNGTVTSPTDTVTIPATQSPALELAKSANPLTYSQVGQEITYDYELTNSGNVTLSAPFTVTDDKATVTCPADVLFLSPGQVLHCTATSTIKQEDLDNGSLTNIATATAMFGDDTIPSNQDTATVTALQDPKLTLVKDTTTANYDEAGDVISYSYTLTNSGNVTLTGPFSVTDDKTTVSCTQPVDGALSPFETMSCTATYTILQSDMDAGSVVNIAAGHGYFGSTPVASNEDSETVPALAEPALGLTKSADPLTYDAVNDVIEYTYVLTNIGNVTLSGAFTVTDDKATVTCPDTASLAPDAFITCEASYSITQVDLDARSVVNTATGHGFFGETPVDSNNASATVTAVPLPALTIVKTATPTTYDAVGNVISYSFVVTNSGNVTLHDPIVVSDDKATDESCPTLPAGGLAPGAFITCTASYAITQTDLDAGSVTNSAYATSGATQSNTDTETVTADQNPALTIDKSVTETSYDATTDVLHYSYIVTNAGNVTLNGPFTVHDDRAADESCPAAPTSLAPGESITCTATYAITQADLDAGSVKNYANATVVYDGETVTSNTDDATVTADQNPALTLDKEGSFEVGPDGYAAPGELISYSFAVKNTGNITLHNVLVTDPLQGMSTITCEGGSNPIAVLEVGVTRYCSATYPVTQADIDRGYVDNIATADSDETGSVTDDNREELPQLPGLMLEKTVTSSGPYDWIGDLITYQLVATNTGLVTLTNVSISDPLLGTLTCTPEQPATLGPGQTLTCTGSYAVQQGDLNAGFVANTATADSDQTEPDTADANVPLTQSPALELDKTVTSSGPYDSVGDMIYYQLVATNTGNITLHEVSIADPMLGTLDYCIQPATLAPTETLTCTGSHPVTQPDLDAGSFYNIATADSNETEPVTDDVTVPMAQNGVLTLKKTGVFDAGADGYADVGELITYEFEITNTGNVTLHNITVTDPLPGLSAISCPKTTLAVPESMTCTATYAVTQADIDAGSVYNLATADSDESGPETGENTEPLPQHPAMTVVKSSATTSLSAPATVTYEYLVTNAGNVTLTGITLSDNNDNNDMSCPATTLEVGESMNCTATHTFTQEELDAGGSLDNTVTADSTQTEPVTDDLSIPISQSAAMTVAKSSTTASLSAPATVTYDYLVTNTGNVTLTGIVLSDNNDEDDLSCPANTLAVGASMTCTATHEFTQAELDAGGKLDNTVTADSAETMPVTDDLSIPITRTPAMTVEKSSTTTSLSAPATVTYEYQVTNTGNTTLTGITLSDNNDNDDMSCPATTLGVGASMTCTATHTFTQAELDAGGTLDNTVTADSAQTEPVIDNLSIPISQSGALTVEKSSTTTSLSAPGTVTYSYVVTNTGNVTLTDIVLSDDNIDGAVSCPATTLAVGVSMTCSATHTFTQAELDANGSPTAGSGVLYNVVTADSAQTGEVTDYLSIPITQSPSMTVEKTSQTVLLSETGTVTYNYLVTNTGNLTLTGIVLSDNNDEDDMVCESDTLAVGASMTCSATHVFTQDELDANGSPTAGSGVLYNVVTADSNETGPATDNLSIPIDQNQGIIVVKASTTVEIVEAGQVVPYTFTVSNPGNVTLTGVTVSDPMCDAAPVYVSGDANEDNRLQRTETWTFTCDHTVTQVEIDTDGGGDGDLDNTVTADSNESEPDTDVHSIPIDYAPAMTVAKSSTTASLSAPATVTYSYLVTNTGNVTLTGIALSDNNDNDDMVCPANTLAVGASMTCTATHTFTQDELDAGGSLDNIVTADSAETEPVTDILSIPITRTPVMTVVKSSTTTSLSAPATVTYSYLVTNTGNTTLTGIALSDNNDNNDMSCPATELAVGESMTCTATHTFTQAELDAGGSLDNVVTASSNEAPDATDDLSIPITQDAGISLVKSGTFNAGEDTFANVGELISYEFRVTNTGNTTLTGIAVTDPKVGPIDCPATELPVGESMTCTGTYAVTQVDIDAGQVVNLASADSNETPPAEGGNTEQLPQNPAIQIIKGPELQKVEEGATVTFDITVTNTGNVSLTNVDVTDALAPDCNRSDLSLAVGESFTYTCTAVANADFTNVAVVTGSGPQQQPVSDDDDAVVDVLPTIAVSKLANPATVDEPGADVTFTVNVLNTSPEDVTLTSLVDNIYGDLDGVGTCDVPVTIAAGATYSCAFTQFVSGNAGSSHTNIVSGTANDNEGNPAGDTGTATVTVSGVAPLVDLVKEVAPDTMFEPGGPFTYTLTITNNSVEPVEITALTDTNALSPECTALIGLELPVAGSTSCTYTVTQTEAGTYQNTAEVTVIDNDGVTASDSDDASVKVFDVKPTVTLDKSVTPETLPEPGGVFTYTLTITNTSVEAVTITALTDTNALSQECLDLVGDTLAVNQSVSCQYTVPQTDDGIYPNTATVTVEDNEGNPASDEDTASVTVTDTLPAISVTKVASPVTLPEPGGVFTYTYVVTNTGMVPVTVTSVTDSVIGVITLPADVELLPGESTVAFTATWTYTDDGVYLNTVTALAVDDDGNEADATANASVEVTDTLPAISVTKVASPLSLPEPGGVFTYTYVVTNTGTVPVTVTSVTDSVIGAITLPADVELLPGESTAAFTATWTYTDDGVYGNTVTALAVDDDGNSASAEAAASVTVTDTLPEVSLVKTAAPLTLAEPGGAFTFTLLITNHSVEPVEITALTDDNPLPATCTNLIGTVLAANGGTATCSYPVTYTETGVYPNEASVSVTDDDDNIDSATDDTSVEVTDVLPSVDLVKTASPLVLPEPGGVFTYTLEITNTSVEPVTINALTDDNALSQECLELVGDTLAVGQKVTCQYTATFTNAGVYPNTAEVTVADNEGNPASDDDDASVEVTNTAPAIEVTKTASPTSVPETGGDVTFTFVVKNLSVEPVELTVLSDSVFGDLHGQGTCALPQSIAVSGEYTCAIIKFLRSDSLTAHTNVVTATAVDDDGTPSTDTDDETVTFTDVAPAIAVIKTANPTSVPETGGLVEFTFMVENIGTEAVTITSLSDSVYGELEGDEDCEVDSVLPVDGSCTFSITRWVEGDFGAPDHENVFTAVAVDNDRTTATDNDDATVAFNDVPPAIVVTKTASPTTLPETGGDVTFTFVVENTGPEAVTLTSLVDDAFGDLNGQGTCATGGLIPVGGSYTCSITVFLSSDSLAAHTNEVTAVGTDDDGTTATDDDDAIVTFTDVAPSIKVTKTADLTVLPETGGNVTFTFVVTNDGVEDVTLTSLTDSVFGNLNGQGDCVVPQTILVSGSYTCSVTKFLAADDLTAHTNLVTAVGTDDDGTTDTATDDETVTFTDVAPAVKVTKTASPTHVPETGGNVTFTFVVENTGQEDVTLTELTDTVFGDLNGQGNCVVPQTIAIGDSYTCSVTKFLASDSLADHYNVTTATVVDDDNTPATGTDDETVTFDDVAPMIEVTKTASPTSVPETGTDVTFTFVVENTGQEDVTLTSLTDTVFGDLNGQGTCVTPQTILIGGSYTCQVTKFLAADDLQAHKNVVTATVVDDDDTPATGTDDETVTFTDVAPAINVTKTASPTSVPETGADVTFTFLVENTGQEDVTLTSLTDTVFGDLNGQGTCVTPQTIVIGGSYGCTVTKFLASDSLIAHKNVVTASAVDDDGTTASDKDDETVTFNDVAPAIKVTKTASPTSVPETGANVTFTFLVQNTGLEDVTLNSLVDDVFGNLDGQGTCDLPQTIAVGGSYTCSVTKFLAADDLQAHKNVVTATAVDDDDTPATGTDDETVTFEDVLPVVDLTKSVDSDGTFNIGNDATYTLTIKNTSLEPVEITALTDTHPLPAECTDLIGTILQPGASASCSYTIHYDEAGTYENTATVTVEDGEGNSASDEDDQSVTVYKPVVSKTANGVYDEVHDWQVFKTVNTDFQYGQPGEKIDFIWTVRVEETTHGENYKVTGVITVANTNPDDPITLAISDVLDDGSVAAIGPCTNGTLSGNNLTVPGGNTATCNYSVTPSGDPLDFGTALPDQVTMSVEFGYANGPAYFPVTTITDGGALDGTYTGWCADIDRPIAEKTNYTAKVYSSLESLPAGLIENAQNLDLVNWIINQDYIGKSAGSTLGTYTYGDVQRAIWELIEDNGTASTAGLGSWSQKRVDKIKAAAISKGEGFMPTCGDFVAVILQPTNGKQTVALAQVTFASLGINCADTNVVTAVMGKFTFKASADIVWTPNLINPTATLDDDHKLDWPITVDGDSTFTYQDPAGFTCSTDPSDYPSGYNRNIITNTAVLGFDTGSETATASTQVKCYKPVLEVVKTAKQLKIPETGGYVTYSFEVNNPGIGPLTITSLVDNRFGDLVGDDDCHVGIVLEHNTSCSFDATFWVPAGTAGKTHVNVVTAVGTDPLGNTATDTDDAVVTYLPVMPDISVTKTADKSSVAETGEDVTFTFVVKNTGLKTVTITSLSDSVFGTLSGDEDCKVGTVLEPGGSCEFALTKFIKGDCSGKAHYNVFTAKAKDSSGNIDTATDDEKVTFNGVAPSISVTKTASVETIAEPGGNVTFTFVVKNTGLESVKITSLTDSVFGTLAGSTNCKVGTSLAGGASCTFQITKKITGVTGDIHTNLFTAVAADNDGESATASDDATVKFTNPKPSLTVDKSVNPATITELGGEVTYTFVVKNTGTTALTISSLVDDKLGELAGDDDCKVGVTLEGGAYCSFDVTVALPPAKPGTTHVNVFTATATDSEGTVTTDQDDALVKYTIVLPDISVTKTADKASVVETGEDVTFTFVVENIGLKPVVIKSLSDSVFGVLTGDEDCMVGTTLEVGGSCSFSITRFISGEAGKGHYNVFTAKAIDNNGNIDSASDDEKIAFTGVIPAITVTKTANPETLDEPGGKVTYTFVVSNTGDEALKITSLFDSVYGKLKGDKDCKVGITLAAGKSCSFTLTKLVIGDAGTVHNNLFTAQGKDNEGNLVEASDDATVTILDKLPTIKVEKIPSAKIAVSGSKIKFTVKVKNTSLEPVTLNSLVDDVFGDLNGQGTCSVPKTLKVGSTYTCYFYGVVTSQTTLFDASYHVNTVTAAAVDNENNTATGSATAKIKMAWRGRTPGYWKNHTSGWPKFSMENYLGQTVAIKTSTPVLSVFELPASLQTCSGTTCILDLDGNKKDDTLLNALSYKGGSTLAGKAQILLRAATAALLNEAYFKDGYPPYGSVTELVNAVNATLATQDEAKYVAMAAELDWWNNGVH